ncbi:DNA repair exonuclease [Bacillus sp. FJAT-49736]|uniref:metallophosphoesterase family protein n=1 Tax=Bacillus sp. FJAT-49736 TaxID=2833582 RepID=UPI001BC8E858|nr:DNA repair exonuclease [Bacillus sp. FJAT-49736]MBS4171883.1 DNA repair exonuclease [Bacillus sp. FJAT-49736]
MENITFIHCADLHLDSPFVGLQYMPKEIFNRIQESTFTAFTKVVDAAISQNVDFVIISGDLYDGEDRSIKAQARLRKQLERLANEKIEVYIVHGNHDHLGGVWTTIEMPDNAHIFSANVEMMEYISKTGVKVHLYGFSYPEKHVRERRIDLYNKIPGADLDIGILHGHCEGGSSIHQTYALFSIRDLLEKDMDYWALGHIHKRQILHQDPYIVYPGNIQGRSLKEQSMKGCYAVTLSKNEASLNFIETSDIIWESITISARGITYFHDLFTKCKEAIEAIRKQNQATLLQVDIQDTEHLEATAHGKITNGELLEILQDGETEEDQFVWTYRLKLNEYNAGILNDHQMFKKELGITIKELEQSEVFEEALGELFSHIKSNRYLEKISSEEKKEIVDEAEQWLTQLLQEKF